MSIFDTPDDTTYDIVTIQPCGQSAVQPNILWQSAPIHFRGRQLLTAQITTNERFPGSVLSLISWRVKADGSIMHTGESVPRCLNTTTHRGASVSANSSLIDIIHAEKTVTAIRFRDGDVSKIELAS